MRPLMKPCPVVAGEISFLLGAETVQSSVCPQMVALSTDAMFRWEALKKIVTVNAIASRSVFLKSLLAVLERITPTGEVSENARRVRKATALYIGKVSAAPFCCCALCIVNASRRARIHRAHAFDTDPSIREHVFTIQIQELTCGVTLPTELHTRARCAAGHRRTWRSQPCCPCTWLSLVAAAPYSAP